MKGRCCGSRTASADSKTNPEDIIMIEVTIDKTTLKAITLFRAKKDIRKYLNGACVMHNARGAFFVASDGCAIAVARIADSNGGPDESYCIQSCDIDSMLAMNQDWSLTLTPGIDVASARGSKAHMTVALVPHTPMPLESVCKPVNDDLSAAGATPAIYDPKHHALAQKSALTYGYKLGGRIRPRISQGVNWDIGIAKLDAAGTAWAWVAAMRLTVSEMPSGPAWWV